jgi:hypothetical protein
MAQDQTTISFNQAWKDFLLIRPFTRNAQLTWTMNKGTIIKVETSPLKTQTIDGKIFVIDDVSCEGYVLAFPLEMIQAEFNEKIGKKLIGRTFTNEQIEAFKGKLNADLKNTVDRLGCANDEEIKKALITKNYWEVLFSSHQMVEYRLHKLILYKSSEINATNSSIMINSFKQRIEHNLQTFKHLVELNYLLGSINSVEYQYALTFNSERDNIAHKLLKREVSEDLLKTACNHGLELARTLEVALQRMIGMPRIIFMDTFTVHEIL